MKEIIDVTLYVDLTFLSEPDSKAGFFPVGLLRDQVCDHVPISSAILPFNYHFNVSKDKEI